MKTIRSNVFETNSASCHAITFSHNAVCNHTGVLRMFAEQSYSGGGILDTPEEKADYFSVALATYLRAKYINKHFEFWNGRISDSSSIKEELGDACGDSYLQKFPLIPSIARELISEAKRLMDEIQAEFKSHGVEVSFSEGNYGFIVAEDRKITRSMRVQDIYDLISFQGDIDHSSSPEEDPDCDAAKLAKLAYNPESLYEFIFNDSTIDCKFVG